MQVFITTFSIYARLIFQDNEIKFLVKPYFMNIFIHQHFNQILKSSLSSVFLCMGLSATIVLSGCATGNHIEAKRHLHDLSELTINPNFTTVDTQQYIASEEWWTVWRDPQLNQLMQMLDDTVPTIQIAQARLDRAYAMSDLSQTNRHIQGNVSANATIDRYPEHSTYPESYAGKTGSSGSILANLRWHLDLWGKWTALNNASASNVRAARFTVEDTRLSLQTAIASQYIQWYMGNEKLKNQQQQIDILRRLVEINKRKRDAGLTTQSTVIQTQSLLTTEQRQIPEIQHKIELYQNTINTLLGRNTATSSYSSVPVLQLQSNSKINTPLSLNWIGQRPDMLAKRESLNALLAYTDATRASFYPNVDLTAFAGFQSLGLDYLLKVGSRTAAIGPAISLPIFEQNRLRAELKTNVAEFDEAVAQYNQSLLQAIQQTTDTLQLFKMSAKQRLLIIQSIHESEQLWHIQHELLKNGLVTQQDELQAKLNQLQRNAELIQINEQMTLAQIELTHTLGGYWAFSN